MPDAAALAIDARRAPPPGGASERFKAHKKRADKAWTKRTEWQKTLDDAYAFVAPYRQSNRQTTTSPSSRANRIFDNTAVAALFRFAGKLQQELFPPGQAFFALEPGPAVKALGMNEDQVRAQLEQVTAQIQPVFMNGEWDNAVHEMFLDLGISTGFMLVIEGDQDQPVRFITASMDELAIDSGPFNAVGGIFWKRKWARRALREAYPKGTYSRSFIEKLEADSEEEITVCMDVTFNSVEKKWLLQVYEEKTDDVIWTETSRECPWITPRYFKMPGETYGFGPVLMVLPTVKTLNKAQEITLKTAALAMLGIFTRIDDGVFNPDTARLEPGAMWTVARNGGVLGPSIQKLEPPGDLQISNIVMQDLRMQIQAGMLDQQLPPDANSPRSAAEIIERVKRLAQDHAGAFGRLVHEIVQPVVRRVIEILFKLGVLKTPLKIDQLLVQVRVTSPLAAAFNAIKAQLLTEYWQAMNALAPDLAPKVINREQTMVDIGKAMGVPASNLYPQDVRDGIANTVQLLLQAALKAAAEQQKQAEQVPTGDPAQGQQAMAA